MKVDRRYVRSEYEVRADGDTAVISGYAAVFNARTGIGWFVEQVMPGAFDRSVNSPVADVRALKNHDPNFVIGRTTNGTLKLSQDDRGLHYEAHGNLTKPSVQELVADLERGDIDQSSFGFYVPDNGDEWGHTDDGMPLRSLVDVGLYDVSPVTFPAYLDTTSGVDQERALRSIAAEIDPAGAGFLTAYQTRFVNVTDLEKYLLRAADTTTDNSSQANEPLNQPEAATQNPASLEAKRRLLEWQRLADPTRK